jgi:hypothetical protein
LSSFSWHVCRLSLLDWDVFHAAVAAAAAAAHCSEREKLLGMSGISFLVVFVLTRCAQPATAAAYSQ